MALMSTITSTLMTNTTLPPTSDYGGPPTSPLAAVMNFYTKNVIMVAWFNKLCSLGCAFHIPTPVSIRAHLTGTLSEWRWKHFMLQGFCTPLITAFDLTNTAAIFCTKLQLLQTEDTYWIICGHWQSHTWPSKEFTIPHRHKMYTDKCSTI
jgi:hypothetical protein